MTAGRASLTLLPPAACLPIRPPVVSMEIINRTKLPLKVPLPGGKKLFLVPGKPGQIAPKAAEHPPLRALIDAGDIEVLQKGRSQGTGGTGGGTGATGSQGGSGSGGIRHSGDR